jgi:hypothetical protein
MPMASMLAPSQRDWDRNACHVRKSVVLMFRINLQITHVRYPRPGSRTGTSAPSVAWCTCRAPKQASSPRFWPPGQR